MLPFYLLRIYTLLNWEETSILCIDSQDINAPFIEHM